jgi:hypothetical protein
MKFLMLFFILIALLGISSDLEAINRTLQTIAVKP